MKIEGSNSAAHDADYDNSDGRAACSTISQGTTAFRWEQNTQMKKSENVIKNKISISIAIDWKGT